MLYTADNNLFEPKKEVIKLELDVNTKHYPSFPKVLYVSEFNLQSMINKLSGLDISVKTGAGLSDEDYEKSWICYGIKVTHTTNDEYFGINGNTLYYRW